MMILAECPEVCSVVQKQHANVAMTITTLALTLQLGRSFQTAAPAKIQVQICHWPLKPLWAARLG